MKLFDRSKIYLVSLGFVVLSLSVLVGSAKAGLGSVLIDSYYSGWVEGHTGTLKNELISAGYIVEFNTSPIELASLAGYDVYVLFFPGQSYSISTTEADTIANWVEAGHGLWLGGSKGGVDATDSCNAVSSHWGVTFNSDDYTGVVTDITYGHLVTDGGNPPATQVDAFGIYMGCSLSLDGGLSLARYAGQTVMAGLEPGNGRAILIGDSVNSGPFDNTRLYEYDNRTLAVNTVQYLVPEPATVALLGLGSLALLRKRRKYQLK